MQRILVGLGTPAANYLAARGDYKHCFSFKNAAGSLPTCDEAIVVAPGLRRLGGNDLGHQGSALAKAVKKSAGRVVIISSLDVYPSRGLPFNESHPGCDLPGKGDLWSFERRIVDSVAQTAVLRLPDLFGPCMRGLSSLLLTRDAAQLNRVATHQWYPITRLERDIAASRKLTPRIVNLCAEPLPMRLLMDTLFPGQLGHVQTPAPYSRIKTLFAQEFGGNGDYIMSAQQILHAIVGYVQGARRFSLPAYFAEAQASFGYNNHATNILHR